MNPDLFFGRAKLPKTKDGFFGSKNKEFAPKLEVDPNAGVGGGMKDDEDALEYVESAGWRVDAEGLDAGDISDGEMSERLFSFRHTVSEPASEHSLGAIMIALLLIAVISCNACKYTSPFVRLARLSSRSWSKSFDNAALTSSRSSTLVSKSLIWTRSFAS